MLDEVTSRWKMIYLMGTGRSGSTILDVILGCNDGVINVGELTHIFRDGFKANQTCSCGRPMNECEFWSRVERECGWNYHDLENLARVFSSVSKQTNFLRIALFGLRGRDYHVYKRGNQRLLDAISRTAKANIVVDSSKYAGRAIQLAKQFPDSVAFVCLTRSPEGVLNSFRKPTRLYQPSNTLVGVLAYYCYVLICLKATLMRLREKAIVVRYEELCADPVHTIERIGNHCGIDLTISQSYLAEQRTFEVGHLVTGNIMRYLRQIQFAPDLGPFHLSKIERLSVTVMRFWRSVLQL